MYPGLYPGYFAGRATLRLTRSQSRISNARVREDFISGGARPGRWPVKLILGTNAFTWPRKISAKRAANAMLPRAIASAIMLTHALAAASPLAEVSRPAFVLQGTFTDEFNEKPYCDGRFEARAHRSDALIDMTLRNGFRELAGTDGRDTFTYCPVSGGSGATNVHSLAYISEGRFPANASFYSQLLWLAVTSDRQTLTNLAAFSHHFYGDYRSDEITAAITDVPDQPGLLESVKWYAPNTIGSGKAQQKLAFYPDGWLTAELSVRYTNAGSGVRLPAGAVFTRYKLFAITNAAQISDMHARRRDEVQPLERVAYVAASVHLESPPASYVPEIVDKTAIVDDKRIGRRVELASSGKWWAARELIQREEEIGQHRRPAVLAALLLILLIPGYTIMRWIMAKEKRGRTE
jgi:hypothetical protein